MDHDPWSTPAGDPGSALIVAVGARLFAVPLAQVSETMRPLPIEPFAGMPAFVPGLSVVRGAAIPVVDLGALLGGGGAAIGRFVVVKCGERRAALGVDEVVGVQRLGAASLGALPPMLGEVASDVVSALGLSDAQLLVVLRTARLVPESAWAALAAREAAPAAGEAAS